MMIGTVYVINKHDDTDIRRDVCRSLSESVEEFIADAAFIYEITVLGDYRIEFGPIGPPWRKV